MPFTQDGYEAYTEDEIYDALKSRFENQFSATVESGDVVNEMLRAEASVISDFQEQMISRVYDSAFVELASDEQLTMKAREVGVVRQSALPATGVVTFSSSNPVTQDRNISSGTVVQTNSNDVIEFETLEEAAISHIDGFESGLDDSWVGDVADASIVSENTYAGEQELKLSAVAGSELHNNTTITRGSEINVGVYNNADTIAITQFGVQNSNNLYQIVTDASSNYLRLEKIESGTKTTLDESNIVIPTAQYLQLSIDWQLTGDIVVTLTDSADNFVGDVFANNETTFDEGGVGVKSGDSNAAKYWDEFTTTSCSVNVQATTPGSDTNVEAGSVSVIKDSMVGVDAVTNQTAIGSTDHVLIGGERQVRGTNEERDEALRERVFDSLSGGGQGTKGALYTAISNIDDVVSLSIFTNEESVDNTSTGGLPPYSSEIVVYGGSVDKIVREMYDTMSFVDFLRLHSGSHGSSETYDVYDETLDENYTGEISRPPKIDLDVTVDLVYSGESYPGASEVSTAVVEYVGGQTPDNESIIGLGVGDDVYKSRIRTAVTSLPGVIGVTSISLDTNNDGADDSVANTDGLSVIEIPQDSVAQVNAYEGAVTINETQQ